MRRLAKAFKADDQRGDWYAWTTNQAGHALYFGVIPGALLSLAGVPYVAAFVLVALAYGVGWEVLAQPQSNWGDAVTDAFFVAAGAGLGAGLYAGQAGDVLASVAIIFAINTIGIWRRAK